MMYKKVYFIGIGGISQSGLAYWCLNANINVFGSDIAESDIIDGLKKSGATIFLEHKKENIETTKPDVVVYNGAISDTNPEMIEAKKLNIEIVERSKFLYFVSMNFKNTVAICGCHGKTSSVANLYKITKRLNPTVHNGGIILPENKSFIIGDNNLFITEACEFKESFLNLNPNILVVLNIDADHLDYFKNLENVKMAYLKFALKIKNNGYLIVNLDDKNSEDLIELKDTISFASKNISVYTFGLNKKADCRATNIREIKGRLKFNVYFRKKLIGKVDASAIGAFHVKNILACICAAIALKVPNDDIFNNITSLAHVKRRMEEIVIQTKDTSKIAQNSNKIFKIYHDYAHHPTEIKSVIEAVKKSFKKSKIYVVFEPHTYTRTQALENDFIKCFEAASAIKILPIYAAREQPITNVTSENLSAKIKNAEAIESYEKVKDWIFNLPRNEDIVILILGAGLIVNLAKMIGN